MMAGTSDQEALRRIKTQLEKARILSERLLTLSVATERGLDVAGLDGVSERTAAFSARLQSILTAADEVSIDLRAATNAAQMAAAALDATLAALPDKLSKIGADIVASALARAQSRLEEVIDRWKEGFEDTMERLTGFAEELQETLAGILDTAEGDGSAILAQLRDGLERMESRICTILDTITETRRIVLMASRELGVGAQAVMPVVSAAESAFAAIS